MEGQGDCFLELDSNNMPKRKQDADATGAAAGTTAAASSSSKLSSKKCAGKKVKVLPSPVDDLRVEYIPQVQKSSALSTRDFQWKIEALCLS